VVLAYRSDFIVRRRGMYNLSNFVSLLFTNSEKYERVFSVVFDNIITEMLFSFTVLNNLIMLERVKRQRTSKKAERIRK
jgi:hypothetical protein